MNFSSEDHVTLNDWANAQANVEGVQEVSVGKISRAGNGLYMTFVKLKKSTAVILLRMSNDGDILVRKVTYVTNRNR